MFRMSLYAHPHVRNSGSYFGYAYTYQEIEKHMRNYFFSKENGYLDMNSPKSKIQLYYGSPRGYFFPHQYKIQMTQWESTKVPPGWVEDAKEYDEWWTANKFGADAFIEAGVPSEKIHIYEHGVDAKTWFPKKRKYDGVVRFLHVDSGSPRKRGDFAEDAFKAAFGNNMNYELTRKWSYTAQTQKNWFDKDVLENHGEWKSGNIRYIKENMSLEELVNLFHYHDALIYPSEGEGFGLIPLQALATGMPVISTGIWPSYEKYMGGNVIDSKLGISPIVENYQRFGDVVLPDFDSTVYHLKNVAENIESQFDYFYNQIPEVIGRYDWQNLTNDVLDKLVARVGIDMFKSYQKIYTAGL